MKSQITHLEIIKSWSNRNSNRSKRTLLDLYTYRFGQKKLVRSEPSVIVKDSILSHHLSQPQLSKLIG